MTYRVILICDTCSAVGPHADGDGPDRASATAFGRGIREGWRLSPAGHACQRCAARSWPSDTTGRYTAEAAHS